MRNEQMKNKNNRKKRNNMLFSRIFVLKERIKLGNYNGEGT